MQEKWRGVKTHSKSGQLKMLGLAPSLPYTFCIKLKEIIAIAQFSALLNYYFFSIFKNALLNFRSRMLLTLDSLQQCQISINCNNEENGGGGGGGEVSTNSGNTTTSTSGGDNNK
jgi:hypothetical protein